MTETITINTIARERVDALTERHAEPQWLRDARLSAWELYLKTPMPTGRDEQWRRTEIAALDLSLLRTLDCGSLADAQAKAPAWFKATTDHIEQRSGILLQLAGSPGLRQVAHDLEGSGVIFTDLASAVEKHADTIRPYLTSGASASVDGKFGLLNKAFFNCGFFLYVPAGVEIELPFITGVGFADSYHTRGGAIFPRLIVVAEEQASLNLIHLSGSSWRADHERGLNQEGDGQPAAFSLVSSVVEIFVGADARVSFLEAQQFSDDVFAIGRTQTEIGRQGQFTSLAVAIGGKQCKSDIATLLNGPGASNDVLGIVLGNGRENFSFNTIEEHNAGDTRSNINFRIALKDSATSVYQGNIKVAKAAQKTDAYQQNKNLLLGSAARADSIPRLEILADDVKCSHGATVGPVDKDQIFYLTSRGLTQAQAEELIVLGFFKQVLDQFGKPFADKWLSEVISRKVYGYEEVAPYGQ